MIRNVIARLFAITASGATGIALLLLFSPYVGAQAPPTLTNINPQRRTNLMTDSLEVTLTGTGFTDNMSLGFDPSGLIDADTAAATLTQTGGTSAKATFKVNEISTSTGLVNIWVQTASGHSAKVTFDTAIASATCLEALKAGGCALLWQVDATSATGSSSQSNNNTAPNILVRLDYQWRATQNRIQKRFLRQQLKSAILTDTDLRANPFLRNLLIRTKSDQDKAAERLEPRLSDHLDGHLDLKTGYTQTVVTTNIQPTSGGSCPSGTSTPATSCVAAVPQQAFVAELGTRLGWTTAVNGQSVFGEFGLGARGSFQYLIPNDKVVQSGGLTYIDLSSTNPNNAVGLYEATGHFRLMQLGHNLTTSNTPNTQNSSNLLVLEGGYQNNRGLQQLIPGSPLTNTRERYVARFRVNPELSGTNHTQLTIGMDYSGGINGGPHVIQLFFGTNINPARLFHGSN